jgi:hypothetical protein
MRPQRALTDGAALAAMLLLALPALAAAQARPLFQWSGRVDREVRLVMRGRDLNARFASWNERGRDRTRVYSVLPREDGIVTVRVEGGRGDVDVIEQPNRRNDFTAVIRIRDPRSGAGDYRLTAYWREIGRGPAGPGSDRGDRNGQDRGGDPGWTGGIGFPGPVRPVDGAWTAGRGELRWSGLVDDEVDIRIQGNRVTYVDRRGDRTRDVREDLRGGLPRAAVRLHVDKRNGRGNVTVVQQPSSWNGYTAVLRVKDARAGADRYDLDVTW